MYQCSLVFFQQLYIFCVPIVPRCVPIWHLWFPLPIGNQGQFTCSWDPAACTEFVNQSGPESTWDGTNPLYPEAGKDYTDRICHIGIQLGAMAAPTNFQPIKCALHDHSGAEFPFSGVTDVGYTFRSQVWSVYNNWHRHAIQNHIISEK